MSEARGYNVACCVWGAILLAVALAFALWPVLRDRIEGEQQHFEQLDQLGA